MKTRRTFFGSFAFLFLSLIPISVLGQSMPHTFSANTAAKASEVNENFTYLLDRFKLRTTTINCLCCSPWSGINTGCGLDGIL